ncbi:MULTISPECIES: tRNA uridine-5-carboxymethylaminomethyl(34) synthesis GTPase MnmE [unclassified Marinobacterium]|uniref:tRNA uridine-5-carboxymethylaminomethyl(34) synthesis GTPase MnmE n=1 Tax=unclassified Marinobacterium TaxID=2644139 RepID=UPI001568FD9F|nr:MULTISPECIES: tRNA uridine-5-carboxymethylaminomethyl(34) synthesis GTPase MnmE [unclassified Marinobacterium]NRP11115.1 tRNA modification GTPase MnmE [Marinobacterium sp. xm-g-48]NRP36650.1 tRNA modification GTPase MnmE [Marinobacterium sp. xm-d-579]NRP46526.1 tRNA modification GTPase MnmE [Marinobacterium sp. xm-d-543]NRP58317.1 tRNA modification GTPase MnmE [Marinobacterium sp. xm-d-510]NRP60414.1 tRNA modification GTPase MnmE [Marinobacterium sp. xm-d-564]
MISSSKDTIVAQATATGQGGVGIVRLSGPKSAEILEAFIGFKAKPRYAHYTPFHETDQQIDEGIALLFPGPNSFTGEDVAELQCHGGPVVIDLIIRRAIELGARMARPGEFSERAFLNDKLDLTQAEAIADLIESSSEQAARCALKSLQGAFSREVDQLVDQLTNLRIYVEAAIDFPDEEIDFLSDGKVRGDLVNIIEQLNQVQSQAQQGSLMREGMTVVIAGRPNAGKSSLLNALSGRDSAIVTDIEGTTRDVLREQIHIDGMPLHIIDTAGLRDAPDRVEQIGIDRAWQEIKTADRILMLVDASHSETTDPQTLWPEMVEKLNGDLSHVTLVRNKIDLTDESTSLEQQGENTLIRLSAKDEQGIDLLREHLKSIMGYQGNAEGAFMARRRHMEALEQAQELLNTGLWQLDTQGAGELLAEDLRQTQQVLGEITGKVSADDLLGKIFGSFCIGK